MIRNRVEAASRDRTKITIPVGEDNWGSTPREGPKRSRTQSRPPRTPMIRPPRMSHSLPHVLALTWQIWHVQAAEQEALSAEVHRNALAPRSYEMSG